MKFNNLTGSFKMADAKKVKFTRLMLVGEGIIASTSIRKS